MGLSHSPKIVTNGLVFAYDMGNTNKSWKGAPITNEAKNASNQVDWTVGGLLQAVSLTTVVTNEVYNITSTTGTGTSFRIYFSNAVLTNGATYTISYKYKIISGGPLFRANDWCDTSITRVTTDLGGGVFYETATGTRATYDVTFRFLDFEISNNTVVQIWDLQLELGSFATPYSSTRVRSNTQAILDLTGLNTITVNNLTYNINNTFSFNGSSSWIELPTSSLFDSQAITMESWNNPTTTAQNGFLFEKGQVNTQYSNFYNSDGTFYFRTMGLSPQDLTFTSSSFITANKWNHVVCTVGNGTKVVYVNGNIVAQATGVTGTMPTGQTNQYVGKYGSGANQYTFNGSIAVSKVYNRALTSAEVQQNFNALRGRFGI